LYSIELNDAVSNLRDKAANWKQEAMPQIFKAGEK
jgi:hypothetical protein